MSCHRPKIIDRDATEDVQLIGDLHVEQHWRRWQVVWCACSDLPGTERVRFSGEYARLRERR